MTNPLIGTWNLVGWYNELANGEKFFPLGEDATGYISYSADGFVFVNIAARVRANYEVDDLFSGSVEEDSAAFKSQLSYAGTFTYRDGEVVHHVTASSHPNWVGTEQVRKVRLDGDKLELSAAGTLMRGQLGTAYVLWEKARRPNKN